MTTKTATPGNRAGRRGWNSVLIGHWAIPAILAVASPLCWGQLGDVTLRSDHPVYPGEGAFQTAEDCVRFAVESARARNDQEKALAVFDWLLTHQWHLASPQEFRVPGKVPGSGSDDDLIVYDAARGRFSYGYGLCGTVHAWNEPYWRVLGFDVRRRAFPGHVNSEVFYDGAWRMYDTDMAGVVFKRDGTVAGYADIVADLDLLTLEGPPRPRYPFAWPSDFKTMRNGWREVARQGESSWYAMHHGGYEAAPGIVSLRRGESMQRLFDRDAFGGPNRRRFWHVQAGGPSRNWTFANAASGRPEHRGATSNARNEATYANVVFDLRPDPTDPTWLTQPQVAASGVAAFPDGWIARGGGTAVLTLDHTSPYVIAGDPVDDADPIRGRATDGLVVSGVVQPDPAHPNGAAATVHLEVSPDGGQTWTESHRLKGPFRLDLTEAVKGRDQWRVRLSWSGATRIESLRCVTTCQSSQAMPPRLTPGGCRVLFRSRPRAVVSVRPLLADEKETTELFEVASQRSANLQFVGRTAKNRIAYKVNGPRPAQVVFRVPAGAERRLVGLSAAARFGVRSPTPKGAKFGLEVSTDQGASWSPLALVEPPETNAFSSGWVAGRVSLEESRPAQAWVKVTLDGGGYPTSLLAFEAYGLVETPPPGPARIVHEWREKDQARHHVVEVPAGSEVFEYEVPTGQVEPSDLHDLAVRIEAL